jgi:hypothetical protein
MTIVIGVASSTGAVIGADSRQSFMYSTASGGLVTRATTDFANKLIIVNQYVACATFGRAATNGRMLDHHLGVFRSTVEPGAQLDSVSVQLSQTFEGHYQLGLRQGEQPVEPGQTAFGFLLAGLRESGFYGIDVVLVPGNSITPYEPALGSPIAVWQGQIAPLNRLLRGVDPRLPLPPETQEQANGLVYRLDLGESLQEMVDFAEFGTNRHD